MSTETTILTDVDRGIWLAEYRCSAVDGPKLAGSAGWSISKRTLRGGVSDGLDVVEVNNGALSVSVLPTRGMGLWRGQYRGLPLGWDSPIRRPVNPCFVNLEQRNGLGWLSGFQELMCRCGLSFNGPPGLDVVQDEAGNRSETPLTLHGRIANLPAHYVAVSISTEGPGTLSVSGVVDEATLFGPCLRLTSTLETAAGSNRLRIVDEVTNLAATPAELELLYHVNVGGPFLEGGAQFVAAVREMAPRDVRSAEGVDTWQLYEPPTADFVEQVFFADLAEDEAGDTMVLLRNAAGDKGFSLQWNCRELPCFSLWKNTRPHADGYVTGLEPATNFPNLKSFERRQGRVVNLQPGERYSVALEISIQSSSAEVSEIESRIACLQGDTPPNMHTHPQSKYSPIE